jgi:hypothetical protein
LWQRNEKLLDRDRFIAKLTAAWRTANALLADAATARNRPARGTRKRLNWPSYTRSQKFEVSSMQAAAAIGPCNSALAHKSTWSHMVITRISHGSEAHFDVRPEERGLAA